jgi:hypothetical protein
MRRNSLARAGPRTLGRFSRDNCGAANCKRLQSESTVTNSIFLNMVSSNSLRLFEQSR